MFSPESNEIECHSKKTEVNGNPDDVYLECHSPGNKTPVWTWTPRDNKTIIISNANGMLVHNPEKYGLQPKLGSSSYPLLIMNITEEDEGTYNCSIHDQTLACWNLHVVSSAGDSSKSGLSSHVAFSVLLLFITVVLSVFFPRTRFVGRVLALVAAITVISIMVVTAAT